MSETDKRKGRKSIRKRKTPLRQNAIKSLDDALRFVLNVKQSQNLKQRSLDSYPQHMRYFSDWLEDNYGEISVDQIDIDILREYVIWTSTEKVNYEGHPIKGEKYKQKKGLRPATVNIRIRLLKSFFNVLHEEKVIAENPAKNLKLMKVEKDTVQPLTKDEIKRLLSAPDQEYFSQFRDYVAIMLMLDTGLRVNELCSLEVGDVDLKTMQILLPAIHNKNRKSRVVPFSENTARVLSQLIEETQLNFETEAVFATTFGDPLNEKTIQKNLNTLAKKAEINKQVSPHILRHSFAKYASLNGMDIFTLQRILGHEEITTTRKYVQINDDDVTEQYKKHNPMSWL